MPFLSKFNNTLEEDKILRCPVFLNEFSVTDMNVTVNENQIIEVLFRYNLFPL